MAIFFLILQNRQNEQQKRESCEEVNQDDARAIIPPIETFYRINEDNRTRHFFDMVEPGDVLLCRVKSKLFCIS